MTSIQIITNKNFSGKSQMQEENVQSWFNTIKNNITNTQEY